MPLIPAVAAVIALGVFALEGFGAAETLIGGAVVVTVLVVGVYVVYKTL